jgi:hypothetical protein
MVWVISVAAAGETALTRMPYRPSSRAADFVIAVMAPLAAA